MSIPKIQTAQQANQAALEVALNAGQDTAAIRAKGTRLASDLQAAQTAEQAAEQAAQAAESDAVAEVFTFVIERTHGSMASSSTTELEHLLGEPLPAVVVDPELEHAASMVARAQVALTRAEAEHAPHREQLAQVRDRLQAKRGAASAIKARRAAGDEKPTDAADLALATADAESLEQLNTDARRAADASAPTAARAALATAEANLLKTKNRAVFRAAKVRVEALESAFVEAWRGMVAAGRAVGESSPWGAYQASPNMRRAVTGQIVPGYRGGL